jgi:hypothetical protein
VASVVALKAKGKAWSDVSRELKIDPTSLLTRVQDTEKMLQEGSARGAKASKPRQPSAKAPEAPPEKTSSY